jgi:hypothetical protein
MAARDELPFATLLWQPRRDAWLLTVVCKATFTLAPGELELASQQYPVTHEDSYWDDDDSRSLAVASDLVPSKPRADIVLVGSAFALNSAPVRSLIARLVFESLDKSIEITTDRSIGPDGTVYQGPRFARMPLVYERAAGGPGTRNPAGVRPGSRDAYGRTPFPNITPVGKGGEISGAVEPVGFAPIAPSWPERRQRIGSHAALFATNAWRDQPLPDGIDHGYFNMAPPDQQLDAIATDGVIVLEGLSREHTSLRAKLPSVRPVVSVDRGGKSERPQMRADTLVIDTDQATVTIAWRGHVPLESARQPHRVAVRAERGRNSWQTAIAPATSASRLDPLASEETSAALDSPPTAVNVRPPEAKAGGAALPFQNAVRAAPSFAASEPPVVPAPPPVEAWPMVTPPSPVAVPAPAQVPLAARPVGAMSASNAAADPEARGRAPAPRRIEGDVLDLLWCNPDAAARVRRKPAWRESLASLEAGKLDLETDGAPAGDDPDKVEARREINHVLSRAQPSGADGVDRALNDAIRADGRFAPALILLLGELRFDFDELEMLKATLACATPFATGDEELTKALDSAREFLATPGVVAAPEVTRGMTKRVRDAFHAQKRVVAENYLDDQTERVLLERRAFQTLPVFGAPHLRCMFYFAASDVGIPTYLPEPLKKKLPLFRRMRARMLAEAHFQADQYESHPAALKPVAVARIVR